MTEAPLVRSQIDVGVARITLDSHPNRNALSVRLLEELSAALAEATEAETVRVIVLAAVGSVFCSGADLAEQGGRGESDRPSELIVSVLSMMWHSPKPVVGRINGHARGGGLGLVAACDIAIASEEATFGFPEVRIGVVPAIVSVAVLPRLTDRAAVELFLTGETFDARHAAHVGLVNRAVPAEELDAEVDRCLAMLRRGGPEALAQVKPMIARVRALPMDNAFQEMGALSAARFASEEAQEGRRAFADKREPAWVQGQG